MIGACQFSIRPNGATFWRSSMIATVAPPPSSPARSPSNIGTKLSATPPSATPSWIASFTTLTAFNSPEKACEKRTPAIKLLTQTQTPEPITASVKATAHHRVKSPLTISEMRSLTDIDPGQGDRGGQIGCRAVQRLAQYDAREPD